MADAIANLRARLKASRVAEPDDSDPSPARGRARKALSAVIDFLREAEIELEFRADLHHLYAALEDVSVGRSNELLQPPSMAEGTPKKRAFNASHETMAAAAVTLLKREGWTLDAALSYVAGALNMNKQTLHAYRKNLTGGKLKGAARDAYFEWLDDPKKYPDRPVAEHVAIMMMIGRQFSEKA